MTVTEKPAWYVQLGPCSHSMCEGRGGCQFSGYRWDQTPEFLAGPHDIMDCNGKCGNPFHGLDAIQIAFALARGVEWGTLDQVWREEEEERLTPEQKVAIVQKKEAEKIEEKVTYLSNKMGAYALDRQVMNSSKHGVKKVLKPCKNLYYSSNEGNKVSTVQSECWAWEYQDPKTGRWEKPHTCEHLHPGEPGWKDEWRTNRNFGMETSNNRFAALGKSRRW